MTVWVLDKRTESPAMVNWDVPARNPLLKRVGFCRFDKLNRPRFGNWSRCWNRFCVRNSINKLDLFFVFLLRHYSVRSMVLLIKTEDEPQPHPLSSSMASCSCKWLKVSCSSMKSKG